MSSGTPQGGLPAHAPASTPMRVDVGGLGDPSLDAGSPNVDGYQPVYGVKGYGVRPLQTLYNAGAGVHAPQRLSAAFGSNTPSQQDQARLHYHLGKENEDPRTPGVRTSSDMDGSACTELTVEVLQYVKTLMQKESKRRASHKTCPDLRELNLVGELSAVDPDLIKLFAALTCIHVEDIVEEQADAAMRKTLQTCGSRTLSEASLSAPAQRAPTFVMTTRTRFVEGLSVEAVTEKNAVEKEAWDHMSISLHNTILNRRLHNDVKTFKDTWTHLRGLEGATPSQVHFLPLLPYNPDKQENLRLALLELHDRLRVDDAVHKLVVAGDWHTLYRILPVVLKVYFNAGLDALTDEAGFAAGSARNHIVDGSNWTKQHDFLVHSFEALYRYLLDLFHAATPEWQDTESDYGSTYHEINDHRHYAAFMAWGDTRAEEDSTFKLWWDFMHKHARAYLLLWLAVRSSDWNLRAAS
eukprot:jgi/Chlat1/508/Chrsp103S00989